MTHRPNILFLAHRVPYPPNRGDRIRSWNMLKFLSERANIHLACTTEEPVPAETLDVLNRHCEQVHVQPLPRIGRWIHGLTSLATGRSATEGLFASRKLKQLVAEWSRETRFDSVFVFCSSMFQFVPGQRSEVGRRRSEVGDSDSQLSTLNSQPSLVVDLIDVDSEKWLNYAETAPLGKRQLYRLESRRVRQLETRIARQAHAVTLVSDEEVRVFRQFCDRDNIHPVQNGVDLDYFHPARDQASRERQRPEVRDQRSEVGGQNGHSTTHHSPLTTHHSPVPFTLVFTGVLDYRPNVDGLQWFCREVWPTLRERIPQAEFHIVGRNANDAVRKLAALPGVTLLGELPDIRPPVWNADVVIAPLLIARGIQNKVLEAMAMAKPIVATPQAIEGTGAIPGEHLLSATTPAEWLAALTQLHTDPRRRESLGQAAHEDAKSRFRWSARLAPLAALVTGHQSSEFPIKTISRNSEPALRSLVAS